MQETLENKLIETTIAADKLAEQVTGQKNLIKDQINEMYSQNASIEELISFLTEGVVGTILQNI